VPDGSAEEGECSDDEQDVVHGAVKEYEGHDAEQNGHEVPLPAVRAQPRHADTHLTLVVALSEGIEPSLRSRASGP